MQIFILKYHQIFNETFSKWHRLKKKKDSHTVSSKSINLLLAVIYALFYNIEKVKFFLIIPFYLIQNLFSLIV